MAVIGKIRQHSGWLIFIIGLSIVGFLVMDATNSQFSVLKGRTDSVGEVNGEKITYEDFNKKYEDNVKNREDQMRGQPMDENQHNSIRTETWDEVVNDIIFNKVYRSLGIGVTKEEVREFTLGDNTHPYIRQSFANPQTGQVDVAQLTMLVQNLDKDEPGVEPGTRKRQWLQFESAMKKGQYQQKYNNLISKGLYVPTWMAEMSYTDQTRTADFKYVSLDYNEINDADVKVSDEELKKYLEEHKAKYNVEVETSKLQYITFDIAASASDTAKIVSDLEENRADFAKSETPSDDSLFVKLYSETPFDEVYYTKEQFSSPVTDSFFALPEGSLVGPYVDQNFFKLAKISDRKMISDSVRVREIVFSFSQIQQGDPAAEAKYKLMDSVQKAIDSLGADFGLMAMQFSDDPIAKAKGGDIGWVQQNTRDKMYNDVLFYRAVKGKTYRAVVGGDAVHLFQLVEDKPSKTGVLVTYLTKEIIPSPETERNIYGNATAFASDNQTEAKFKEAAKKHNSKTVNAIQEDAFNVEGLGAARDIVKWAFKAKKGEVSTIFTVDKKHVVVLLELVRAKGLPDLDAVRETIKPLAIREKKFEMLAKKLNDAKATSVDALAAALGKTPLQADRVSFGSPSLGGGTYEAVVVATAFATPAGKLSAPIKGNSGVYVVQTIAIQEAPKQTDYSIYSTQMKQMLQGKSRYVQQAQKKLAEITDTRSEFF